jgi:hypothetical protein
MSSTVTSPSAPPTFEVAQNIGTIQTTLRDAPPTGAGPVGGDATESSLGGVGVDASGNATLVYRQDVGGTTHVVVNRRVANQKWSAATPIDGAGQAKLDSVNGSLSPFLAVNEDGRVYAMWTEGVSGVFSVKAAELGSKGAWAPAAVLASGLVAPQISGMAPGASGDALAVWDDFVGDFVTPRVTDLVDGLPTSSSAPVPLATHTSYGEAIATNAAGVAMAVWIDKVPNEETFSVMAKRFQPGVGWDANPTTISDVVQGASPDWPVVAVDGAGNAVMVVVLGSNVVANTFHASSGWGTATALGTAGSNGLYRPSVCVSEAGHAYATWSTGTAAITLQEIQLQETGGWQAVKAPALTSDDADLTAIIQPRCVVVGQDQLTLADIAWSGGTSTHDPAVRTWAQTRNGTDWAEPNQLGPDDGGWDENPSIGANATGEVVIAWEHELTGQGVSVWATRRALP